MESELLSLDEIHHFMKRLGYSEPHRLYYVMPQSNLNEGLVALHTGVDVSRMVEHMVDCRMVELFQIGKNDMDPLEVSGSEESVEGDTDKSHDTEYDSLGDSDYASSEDDKMYEKYVDLEVEATGWAKFSNNNTKIPHPQNTIKGKMVVQTIADVDSGSDTDCVSASELESLSSSDEEGNGEKRIRPKQFNPDADMENPEFKVHMLFATKEVFVKAVRMHSIVDRRDIKLVKNDKARVRARCAGSCPWECYARKKDNEPTFEVRTYLGKHTCKKVWNTRNCSSKIVAEWYADDFASDPSMSIPNLMSRVQREKKTNDL